MNTSKEHLELLNNIYQKAEDNKKHINSNYISFIGFILALSGVFLGFKELVEISQYIFIGTIFSVTLGFYFYFELENIRIKKFDKIYSIVALAIDNNKNTITNELEENKKVSFIEKLLGFLIYLQDIGIFLFLLGIFTLVYCN